MAWVYMLRCRDNSLYTGAAQNVEKRFAQHSAGKGAKYTRGRLPVSLVFKIELPDYNSALRTECALKKLSKKNKLKLIAAAETGVHAETLLRFIGGDAAALP